MSPILFLFFLPFFGYHLFLLCGRSFEADMLGLTTRRNCKTCVTLSAGLLIFLLLISYSGLRSRESETGVDSQKHSGKNFLPHFAIRSGATSLTSGNLMQSKMATSTDSQTDNALQPFRNSIAISMRWFPQGTQSRDKGRL